MGLYDREYYREERRGLYLSGPRTITGKLILANVVVWVVQQFTGDWLVEWFGLHAQMWRQPWLAYQVFTCGFLHATDTPWHLAFNMLALWFFGSEVETLYGPREYLRVYLTALLAGSLAWLSEVHLRGMEHAVAIGASGAVTGVVILFALNFPQRIIYVFGVMPIPAWIAALFLVLMDLAGLGRGERQIAYSAHLGGAAFGLFYYRFHWHLGRLLPRGWSMARMWRRLPRPGRPRLRLHNPPGDDSALNAEVDAILEKIHLHGEASLTPHERKVLQRASRRYQQRRQTNH